MILSDVTIFYRRSKPDTRRTIFIGTRDKPGLHDGQLVLTQKGGEIFYDSVTEYICKLDDTIISEWKSALGLAEDPLRPFAGQLIEVEDASPDTCVALIAFAYRLSGSNIPRTWVEYTRRWELGDVHSTGAPEASYGALEGALVHAEFRASIDGDIAIAHALAIGVAYSHPLVVHGLDPACLPRTLPATVDTHVHSLHAQAHACLAYERTVYRRLVESASKLQLAIPLRGNSRTSLVDALIFSETELTDTLKVLARTDKSSPTGNGYAFLALYRPGLAMTGDEIAISVDPLAHISLQALWADLERREDAAWTAFASTSDGYARPRARPRLIRSHLSTDRPTEPSDQPWWDDHGQYTLLASPRGVEVQGVLRPGTRLSWDDVKSSIWDCYAPSMGLEVRRRNSTADGVRLTHAEYGLRDPLGEGSGLSIADLERVGGYADDVLLWTPTLGASCAATIESGRFDFDRLPDSSDYDVLEGRGGFVVIAERGILLLKFTVSDSFPADELKRAAADVATTVACARWIEESIRRKTDGGIRTLVRKAVETGSDRQKREALRAIYATKLAAREAWDKAQRFEADAFVRRARALSEARWGARERLDRAIAEIAELEDMVVSSSEVRANAMLNKIAIFGLPASVLGNLLGGLLLVEQGIVKGVSWGVLASYLALSLTGIALLLLIARKIARDWRLRR